MDISLNIRVSSNLLENSFDFLFAGVNILKRNDEDYCFWKKPKEIKAALLSITTAIELLLKAKIASVDWVQIFNEPSQAEQSKILSGEFFSLKFESCFKRLKSISSIEFDKKTIDDIEQIRKIRNRITHYHSDTDGRELLGLTATGLDIFIEFYRKHIIKDFCEGYDRTAEIDGELKSIKDYVQIRLKTLRESNMNKVKPVTFHFSECGVCLQDVFILKDDQTVLCTFCGNEEDIKESAMAYSNFQEQIRLCPKCTRESMAALHQSVAEEEEAWQCIICGYYINRPQMWMLRDGTHSLDSVKEEYR